MLITIDMQDRRPIYEQVADGVRTLIASGQLTAGQSLPSVRQLASDLGVNLNTIAAAYRQLQSDGLIIVKHSGAKVAASTTGKHSEEELRRPLRTALTQLVLSGMKRGQIISMVDDELGSLTHGVKS